MSCLFCSIAAGEIPSDILYQDEEVIAIRDINPQAPTHILVMPRAHIPSIAQVGAQDAPLLGRLVGVANRLAKEQGVAESGYRLITNCGPDSGQEVPHLHFHLLGGKRLGRLCA